MFLLHILIPVCNFPSLVFLMMCSAYRLNKQGNSRQPCRIPFSILNHSVVHTGFYCCFLTRIQISQETGKMVWYSHLFKSFPQFVMIHTVKGFSIVDETEVNVFAGSQRKQENLRKNITSVSSTTLNSLTVWIITNCGKLLRRWKYQTILPVS